MKVLVLIFAGLAIATAYLTVAELWPLMYPNSPHTTGLWPFNFDLETERHQLFVDYRIKYNVPTKAMAYPVCRESGEVSDER